MTVVPSLAAARGAPVAAGADAVCGKVEFAPIADVLEPARPDALAVAVGLSVGDCRRALAGVTRNLGEGLRAADGRDRGRGES